MLFAILPIGMIATAGALARWVDLHGSEAPVLRMRVGPVLTLDPAEASDWSSLREIGRVYETPLRYQREVDSEPSAAKVLNPRRLEPWLLKKMPETRDQGRTWVLDFRTDRRFHPSSLFSGKDRRSGREISACDWVESILRHLESDSRSVWKSYLERRLKDRESIRCESTHQAVVRLQFHDPEFGYFLAHPAASVLPVAEIKKQNWNIRFHPVGSGAFRLEKELTAPSLENPQRLRWRAVSRNTPLRRIEVDLGSDGAQDWKQLTTGRLDLIEVPESLRARVIGSDGKLTPDAETSGLRLLKVARSDLIMVGISPKNSILGSKRGVRLALGLALTPEDVLEPVFGADRAVLAYGPLPPGVRGYRLDYRHLYRGSDVERARDLLGSNGFAHGHGLPTFRLGCLDHPLEQNVCRALMQGWGKVGFQTEKVTLDAQSRRKAILQGEIDLWPVTWVADLPAPASYLEIFSGASEPGLSGLPEIPNLGKASEKLEKILNRIRMAPSSVLMQQSVDEAVDLINLESPAVFLFHRFQFWLVKKGWKGIGLEDFSWHDSDQVSITLQKDEPNRE